MRPVMGRVDRLQGSVFVERPIVNTNNVRTSTPEEASCSVQTPDVKQQVV